MKQRFLSPARRIAVALADGYCIVLVVYLLVKLLIGEHWLLVAIGNSFLHLLILPAFAWLAACMLRRRWKPAAVALLPVLFFIGSYAIMFLPRSVTAAPGEQHLKVLTYNIHSEQISFDPMVALIRASDADLIAIQELTTEAAERFKAEFATEYPYQAFHAEPHSKYFGQGVLSRYPILNDEYWRNESLPEKLGHERTQININGIAFTLYNTHPIHPIMKAGYLWYPPARTIEIDSVLERAKLDCGPVIIVGDFNMTDQSDDYQLVTSHYADTYREVGWGLGFTFPDFTYANASPVPHNLIPMRPVVRLDYLFHNKGVEPLRRVYGIRRAAPITARCLQNSHWLGRVITDPDQALATHRSVPESLWLQGDLA